VRLLTRSFVLLSVVLASVAFAAPKKKKTPPPPPKTAANIATEVAVKKALDGAEEKVGGCVLENAPAGPFTQVVKAALTLNSAGQLMGTTLTLTPEIAAGEKLKKCIDDVLKGLSWPKSTGPIVNAEREWTFESR
jgi:hypothetical protein